MDFKTGIGSLACRLCAASFQMPIHHLHEPVDVFSEWLDDCEAAAQGRSSNHSTLPSGGGPGGQIPRYEEDSEDDVDDIPAPSGLSKSNGSSSGKGAKDIKVKELTSGSSERPSYTDLGLDDSDDSDED